ncbi:MAG: STM4012 family radical SAM protein [Arenicella sp.]
MNNTNISSAEQQLQSYLSGEPYLNYVYSYPHKTSYRDFAKPKSLKQVWQDEDKSSLFLYLHIPFCEMRCGYCNLFTTTNPEENLVDNYLQALERQSIATAEYMQNDFHFEQLAFGGGTPTYLSPQQLQSCFDILQTHLNARQLPASVEVSPNTVDPERLSVLKQAGVERISMGVESFDQKDLKALGRPQLEGNVERALQTIRDSKINRLNIDLIYGGYNQSLASWLYSVDQALAWQPEEIFIYPLYVRPLTGLGRKQQNDIEDQRLRFYFSAREHLLKAGYEQSSMRMFIRQDSPIQTSRYRCQEDGMIGLGAGARSYTENLHYSSHYAVAKPQIKNIIRQYNNTRDSDFSSASYGISIDINDQKRRYVLLSLLQVAGLSFSDYHTKFKSDVLQDIPQLTLLNKYKLADHSDKTIQLNEKGIAHSDLIGNWLFTEHISQRMQTWVWA